MNQFQLLKRYHFPLTHCTSFDECVYEMNVNEAISETFKDFVRFVSKLLHTNQPIQYSLAGAIATNYYVTRQQQVRYRLVYALARQGRRFNGEDKVSKFDEEIHACD